MVEVTAHEHGCVLPIKAQPGARKNAITGEFDGQLKLAVTAAPEKGKANKAIIAMLAKTLGLAKGRIELLAGQTSPEKKFLLIGANADEIAQRIQSALDKSPKL